MLALASSAVYGQEEATEVYYGKRYLDLNIRSLDKYSKRLARQQDHLLRQLKKKETKLQHQLRHSDSAACARLKNQPLSYDSISRLANADSNAAVAKMGRRRNAVFDSLKGVVNFVQTKSSMLPEGAASTASYSTELQSLQQKISYRDYLNELIAQRTNNLKSIVGNNDLSSFAGIQKDVFYGKARMNTWKQVAEDPSKLEEKALEYLQGSEGFDKTISQSTAVGGMQAGMNASDLEKMGYQTKDQLNKALQQKFGNNIGQVQNMMGGQVADWQNKAHDVTAKVKDAKQQVADTKGQLTSVKSQIKAPSVPLNKNPMRGLPFWKRLEKQYNWQTTRATPAGEPAMIQGAVMVGYRQTPKFSYGIGTALNIGMGQDWNHIKFSFQGLSLRSYLQYKFIYGIGAYGGYERTYKESAFVGNPTDLPSFGGAGGGHNTTNYNESILLGLTKSYKLNSKWNGQIQVMYDVWWKEKGMNSPIVLRFATTN
ncbi:hypothetical protein DN068_07095 [Taibaiella soli]|uniref:Uncharacterized protein n=1 Tax=Taibaiella soli TaxID=1649169 RepID=A0A2W2BJX8_9BACT|nr:hypothetical protein DN068_07095 [Taibaiella soli]